MPRIMAAMNLVTLLLAGCGSPPPPHVLPPAQTTGLFFHQGMTAYYAVVGDHLLALVWSDAQLGSASGNLIGGNVNVAKGRVFTLADGKSLEWEIRTPDGKNGTLMCLGQSYDLSDGSLFLAYTRETPPRLLQLPRKNLNAATASEEGLRKLAAEDAQVKAFIEEASKRRDQNGSNERVNPPS